MTVIDAASDEVAATVEVGDGPDYVVFSPDGRRAYVANTRAGVLSVVEAHDYRLVATVPVGDSISLRQSRCTVRSPSPSTANTSRCQIPKAER